MNTETVLDELANIVRGCPLWPGDTLSHRTANECVSRGWADRNKAGNFIPTEAGRAVFSKYRKTWAPSIREEPGR